MNPQVAITLEEKDEFKFTISNINVSLANALRRTILSQIPIVVIRSFPHDKNDIMIHINTSRLNNEILKQRLSCIPIYIPEKLTLEELREYEVEIEKKNESDTIEFITSEDFKIKHKGKLLSEKIIHRIFPPDPFTKDHILFARLRPKISDDLPGEELKITAKLSIGTAEENSMFNVVSTCSYGMTPDNTKQYTVWGKQEKILESKGLNQDEIIEEKKNWHLGEGKRIYKENSFDFILETLRIYSNRDIVKLALDILNDKLNILQAQIEENTLPIQRTKGTLQYAFDLTLPNEDYTIGKVLEFILYNDHYITDKTLIYIGFLKKHPHDRSSIIRMAFKEEVDITISLQYLSEAIKKAQYIFSSIAPQF